MKHRCSACDQYVAKEALYWKRGMAQACSVECLAALRRKWAVAQPDYERSSPRRKKRMNSRASHKGPYRDDIPENVRRRVRSRDGEKCRCCRTKQNLALHHIEYRSQGGRHETHNLIVLCIQCHELVHSNKRYFQPILLGMIWIQYVQGRVLTLWQFERMYSLDSVE